MEFEENPQTAEDYIELIEKYGAHNYHPYPWLLPKPKGHGSGM